ncbi:MAG: hypothetical protein IPJ69_02815 [Deltaproteobacteria bacterium]|nr:MAG: hypothetical protein IPJ69_02815 [Deltaproteobacteria bacterium]
MNGHETHLIPAQELDGYWIESLDINDIHLHRSMSLQSEQINLSLKLIQKAEIFDLSQSLEDDILKVIKTFEKYVTSIPLEKLPEIKIPQVLLMQDIKGRYERLHVNLQLFEHHLKQVIEVSNDTKAEDEIMNIYKKRIQLIQSEAHERIDIMKYFSKENYLGSREVQEFIRETIKQSQMYKGVLMELTQKYSSDSLELSSPVPLNLPDESEVLKMIESLFQAESAHQLRILHQDLQASAVSQLLF